MQREPVSSSSLRSVGYDPKTQTLEVEFESELLYRYFIVPRRLYEGLMAARSKGKYLNEHIKDKSPFERLR